MDQEFEDMDSDGRWQNLYIEIRNQSHECPYKIAKYPENRYRNRYRDVNPFDHSRVKLGSTENDYINASLVVMEEAQRRYILTQGPLKNTCSHFWMMIWEQRTKAIIMLNRVMEKGAEKCAQYWPTAMEQDMAFRDTGFLVTLLSEDVKSYYTTRVLQLQNVHTEEKREIYHFHYTTWPDFGVPDSPASFLNFLFKVRESTSLGADHGPAVVHCSAGIGRSGTFSLVDTCLVLMDKRKDPSSVDIKSILLDMRKYRMGLIQTPDQLRFSYMAVLEGAKYIMGDSSVQKRWRELSKEDQAPAPDSPPPPQPQDAGRGPRLNGSLRVAPDEAEDERPETDKTPAQTPCKEADVDRRDEERTPSPSPRQPGRPSSSRAYPGQTTQRRRGREQEPVTPSCLPPVATPPHLSAGCNVYFGRDLHLRPKPLQSFSSPPPAPNLLFFHATSTPPHTHPPHAESVTSSFSFFSSSSSSAKKSSPVIVVQHSRSRTHITILSASLPLGHFPPPTGSRGHSPPLPHNTLLFTPNTSTFSSRKHVNFILFLLPPSSSTKHTSCPNTPTPSRRCLWRTDT